MPEFRDQQSRLTAVFDKRIAFIVGATRWGTAWVQQCLDTHPEVSAKGEAHLTDILFPRMAEMFEDYNGQCAKIGNRLQVAGLPGNDAGFNYDEIDYVLRTAVALIFERWLAAGDVPCLVEKTPEHVVSLDILTRIVPNARIIHVVRDGRDEALAAWEFNLGLSRGEFPRTYPSFADFAEVFAGNWNRSIDSARRFARVHPERYLEVQCEQIAREPVREAERIFNFLEVATGGDPDMIRVCSDTAWDIAALDLEPGTWRRSFDAAAESAFMRQAGELLKLLGYES